MTADANAPETTARADATATASAGRLGGVALMLAGGLSTQVGASFAALAFPVIGPVGVVAIRQWVAGPVMWAVGRPRVRSYSAAQWRLVAGLALVFAAMNLSIYLAIDRVGLGLAVTLEFLGPLSVALAGLRRRLDLCCALAAAAAVVDLTRPRPSTDDVGIGLALLAGTCWATYILLNRAVGRRIPGVEGPALATCLSALAYVPVGALWLYWHPPTAASLARAVAAGVLSSALPYLTDPIALRRVPAYFFGLFMSVDPVFAALTGWVLLGQRLGWSAWVAIVVIVSANAVAAATAYRVPPTPPAPAHPGETSSP
jgi:inner membrane transporter RhtA